MQNFTSFGIKAKIIKKQVFRKIRNLVKNCLYLCFEASYIKKYVIIVIESFHEFNKNLFQKDNNLGKNSMTQSHPQIKSPLMTVVMVLTF